MWRVPLFPGPDTADDATADGADDDEEDEDISKTPGGREGRAEAKMEGPEVMRVRERELMTPKSATAGVVE